jgi:hypothetical protein
MTILLHTTELKNYTRIISWNQLGLEGGDETKLFLGRDERDLWGHRTYLPRQHFPQYTAIVQFLADHAAPVSH